jgi:hypothetical protein
MQLGLRSSFILFTAPILLARFSAAQDEPQKPDPVPSQQHQPKPTGVNPLTGLGMVSSVDYKPLTGEERWKLYYKQNFMSLGAATAVVIPAAMDHLYKQPPEWGSHNDALGKRLASRFGTAVIQGTTQAAACAALGQDPRYIRSGSSGWLRRAGHAALFSVLTYNNEGKRRFALGTVGSYYASSMATTLWFPGRYTALGDGVRDGNRQIALSALVNQVQEFWPEIRRIFRH